MTLTKQTVILMKSDTYRETVFFILDNLILSMSDNSTTDKNFNI